MMKIFYTTQYLMQLIDGETSPWGNKNEKKDVKTNTT